MDGSKMRELGWIPSKGIEDGVAETLRVLQSLEAE